MLSTNRLAATITFAAFSCLAVATPTPQTPSSHFDTGTVQCRNSVPSAGSLSAAGLLLGVVVQDLTVPIGLTCSPITAIGVSDASCTAVLSLIRSAARMIASMGSTP